jgi:hypothetical protein
MEDPMRRLFGVAVIILSSTAAFAGSPGTSSHGAGGSHPSMVPGTGPGSSSFNAYVHSHSSLARPSPVPNTGPGSPSFNSYVQSHSGLAQYNSPMPTQPTQPLH